MKKLVVVITLFLSNCLFSQNWQTNFDDAKALAIKENKNIILVFSGSDWCAPCIKLEKTVWMSDAFQKEATKSWVTYKADFPKKKANQLAPELTEQNKKLAEKYNSGGSFPLVVLLDKNGKVLGMTGFKNISAEEYVAMLKKMTE
ncbi:thioredoxin family protein [Flavobacterium sp.]|jgi:thioredoxin-related protein|uniref:thioredoxin family protein n=1 Tax=Flavobacterium sp. TaxID=239 RepID=UPI0037BFA8A7